MATSVPASGERLRWFAAMHAYSASIILTLQLTASGETLAGSLHSSLSGCCRDQ
jgi:hypothetical protein